MTEAAMHASPDPTVVVIGLGYVGLPLAVALADHFHDDRLRHRRGADRRARAGATTAPARSTPDRLARSPLTRRPPSAEAARGADVYIVTVPTPVDGANRPDLAPLLGATETVGRPARPRPARRSSSIESTVYPGVTEEVCGPLIERVSGLERGARLLPRLLARADQSGRPRAQHREDRQGRRGRERRGDRARRRSSTAGSPPAACSGPPRSRPPRPPR